jgi:hypothetical protein
VLKSASNNCENVGEKREVVGDDEEGEGETDTNDTIRPRLFWTLKRSRRLELGRRLK